MPTFFILILVIGALLTGLAVLNFGLRRSLRAPRIAHTASLAQHGLSGRQVWLPTQRGKRLFGWLLPGNPEIPSPAVIVLHGWGANAEMMLPLARPLQAAGFTVLLIDARNHGASDADNYASMPRFAEDLDAAIDWLNRLEQQHRARFLVANTIMAAPAS